MTALAIILFFAFFVGVPYLIHVVTAPADRALNRKIDQIAHRNDDKEGCRRDPGRSRSDRNRSSRHASRTRNQSLIVELFLSPAYDG